MHLATRYGIPFGERDTSEKDMGDVSQKVNFFL
jgi:hypothetical protein